MRRRKKGIESNSTASIEHELEKAARAIEAYDLPHEFADPFRVARGYPSTLARMKLRLIPLDTIGVMKLIEISELARRAGVTTATIRHYDRRGLLPPTSRGPGGSRLYDAQSVDRLMLIRRIRATGLSLEKTSGLLGVMTASDIVPSSPEALRLLEQRLRSVRAHLDHVRRVERTLVAALEIGRANGRPDDPASVAVDDAQSGPPG